VYYDRNRLNLMAISMMLPSPSQVLSPCFDPTPDAKIKCMEVNGAELCMRSEHQLNDVLDALKANLKSEQKMLMEVSYRLVHKARARARLLLSVFSRCSPSCTVPRPLLALSLRPLTLPLNPLGAGAGPGRSAHGGGVPQLHRLPRPR